MAGPAIAMGDGVIAAALAGVLSGIFSWKEPVQSRDVPAWHWVRERQLMAPDTTLRRDL